MRHADSHQLKIIPSCTYVQHVIKTNPEFERLVYYPVPGEDSDAT